MLQWGCSLKPYNETRNGTRFIRKGCKLFISVPNKLLEVIIQNIESGYVKDF